MNIEKKVEKYYGKKGLGEAILEQARRMAVNPDSLSLEDLAPFDDMHIGGRKATAYLMEKLELKADMRLLDIGSGIGGPARYTAETYHVHVTGLDLTPEYKDVAEQLGEAVGLEGHTTFLTGSALAMPFQDTSFDAAYMIHAGMNILDKKTVYAETCRVLKPGALFGIYDVMAGPDDGEQIVFPVPWADTQATSFLLPPRDIEGLLRDAGFEIMRTESRKDFALAALNRFFEKEALPPVSNEFKVKVRNLVNNIEKGLCAPWQIICRKNVAD